MQTKLTAQKEWLSTAKERLQERIPELTWDRFASLLGISPRTLKAYRLPGNSPGYRVIPRHVRVTIEQVVAHHHPELSDNARDALGVLPQALAALVLRQARLAYIDRRTIAGTTRYPGAAIGLTSEDRRAMALLSRARMMHGLPDMGAEIHEVLTSCCLPLGDWLPISAVMDQGLENVCLIEPGEATPTPEAEALASGFVNLGASIEEILFTQFREVLSKLPDSRAHQYYTRVREFVVRHPVATVEQLHEFGKTITAELWRILDQQFYIDLPHGWSVDGEIVLCRHCGNAMQHGHMGLTCRTRACEATQPASAASRFATSHVRRCHQVIQQYWVEPGLDEIRLYEVLCAQGLSPNLYPKSDLVDLAFDDVGIDLKAWSSPELLGRVLSSRLGGLAQYSRRWLVIPDRLIKAAPDYPKRLVAALNRPEVCVLSVTEAIEQARYEEPANG